MADKVKKLNPLDRVRAKAAYNYQKRLRDQKELKALKLALETGNPLPGQGGNFESDAPVEEQKGKK